MSRSDHLNRLKQGEEARKRVLSGMYNNRPAVQAPISTRADAIRDFYAREEEANRPLSPVVTSAAQGINTGIAGAERYKQGLADTLNKLKSPASVFNTTMDYATAGNKDAQKFIEQKYDVSYDPYIANQKQIQNTYDSISNPFWREVARYTVEPVSKGLNWAVNDNPVGKFMNRVGYSAADTMGGAAGMQPDTGNKYMNLAADIGGVIAGFTAPIGAPGENLTSTPFKIADNAVMSRAGQATTNALSKPLSNLVKPSTANAIAKNTLREGIMGGIQGGAQAAIQSGNDRDILNQTLIGGGVGGALGAAAPAIATPVRNAINNRRVSNALTRAIEDTELPTTPNTRRVMQLNEPTAAAETINSAPKSDLMTTLFGEQGLGITPFGSNKSSKMVSTEQQIVNNPLKNSVSGALESTKQGARAGYQNLVDYLSPLKKFEGAYDAALDASRANNMANTMIRDKFVDMQGNVIGDSLNDIMKPSRGLNKKVDDYLILRDAYYRMLRGERVYDESLKMTPEKVKQLTETLEKRYPQLKQIGQGWDSYNKNIRDLAVNEGLITRESADTWERERPHYASMRRQFSTKEKLSQPKWGNSGSSFSGQKAPIKEVSPNGSTRKIVSPIRSAIEQTYAWSNAILRNRTMQEIVRSIQLDPEGMKGIAEIVKKPSTSYKSLDEALREGGSEDFLELLDNDFKSLFSKSKSGEENIVRAMVNGKPVYVRVADPEVVKVLLGMGNQASGLVLNALTKLSNATKRGATGLLAPMFAVKNIAADTVQAAIQSPNAIKHIAVDVPAAFISSIADALKIPGLNKLAQDFRRSGGEYSALLRGDRAINKSVNSLRRDPILSPKGIAKGVIAPFKFSVKSLEKVADITENMNRMAAYRRAMVGKERTEENVRNAINAARESTTNFSRRGAWARETEAFVPYSNAAVQGLYRVTKAFAKNPVKTMAGLGTLVIAPKLYEYAKFNSDPDYQKLPARERYRNVFISKNADGTFVKIPMPPEYEAIGAFVQDVLNDVVNKDPDAYKGTLNSLVDAFTPPIVSGALQGVTQGGGPEQSLKGAANATVFAPFSAVISNQSFTGGPIVPQRLEKSSPKQQYDERTSSIGKKIGQITGMSPVKVDYLIRAYGGDPARLLLPLTSPVGGGTPKQTLLKNFIADPVFTNTLSDDYYSMKKKITEAESDNSDKDVPLPSWYDKGVSTFVNGNHKGSLTKRISALNADKRDTQANKSLSAKEKAQKLREIQAEINDLYLDGITRMREAGVPKNNR